jgi:DNA-binding response OmpR family regulator
MLDEQTELSLEERKRVYILILDDDQFASTLVRFALMQAGYEVETMDNAQGALQLIRKREPDLVLLNVAMQYLNGFDFSAKLRDEGYDTPLIFIAAQDVLETKLEGFKVGADDYICEPYHHQELIARIQAIMRRAKRYRIVSNHCIRSGCFELFPADLKVIVGNQDPVMLTPTEVHILCILMSHAGQVVPRDQLLATIWNDREGNSNILDVYIRRLRTKLERNIEKPRYIISIRGRGYKFIG